MCKTIYVCRYDFLPSKDVINPNNMDPIEECSFVPTVGMPHMEENSRKYCQLVVCKIILSMATGHFQVMLIIFSCSLSRNIVYFFIKMAFFCWPLFPPKAKLMAGA